MIPHVILFTAITALVSSDPLVFKPRDLEDYKSLVQIQTERQQQFLGFSLFNNERESNKASDELEVEICNEVTNELIEGLNLHVDPYPIKLEPNGTVTIMFGATLLKNIDVGTVLDVTLVKEGFIPIEIPCMPFGDIDIGSCSYDLNQVLQDGAALIPICPDYVPDGQPCQLPLLPGFYGGEPPLTALIPDDPLVGLLAGTVRAKISLKSADGSEIACVQIRLKLEN